MLLASSGYRLGMLLNILQCTGQLPMTTNYPAHNISRAHVENPCLKIMGTCR